MSPLLVVFLAEKLLLVLLDLGRDGSNVPLNVSRLAGVHKDVIGNLVAESSRNDVVRTPVSRGEERGTGKSGKESEDGKPVHGCVCDQSKCVRRRGEESEREFNALREMFWAGMQDVNRACIAEKESTLLRREGRERLAGISTAPSPLLLPCMTSGREERQKLDGVRGPAPPASPSLFSHVPDKIRQLLLQPCTH